MQSFYKHIFCLLKIEPQRVCVTIFSFSYNFIQIVSDVCRTSLSMYFMKCTKKINKHNTNTETQLSVPQVLWHYSVVWCIRSKLSSSPDKKWCTCRQCIFFLLFFYLYVYSIQLMHKDMWNWKWLASTEISFARTIYGFAKWCVCVCKRDIFVGVCVCVHYFSFGNVYHYAHGLCENFEHLMRLAKYCTNNTKLVI